MDRRILNAIANTRFQITMRGQKSVVFNAEPVKKDLIVLGHVHVAINTLSMKQKL